MGISYDPSAKKWNINYEKTDYKTNHPIRSTVSYKGYLVTGYYQTLGSIFQKIRKPTTKPKREIKTITVPVNASDEEIKQAILDAGGYIDNTWWTVSDAIAGIKGQYKKVNTQNNYNQELNRKAQELNNKNNAKNNAYDKTLALAKNTKGGDYVSQREVIRKLGGIDSTTKKTLEDYYKAFYTTEKLQTWNSNLGAKPPYGEFDSAYYKKQNPAAAQQWASAVANDDIDITQRYGETNFYLNHYTNVGKPAGVRGNPAEKTIAAQEYVETTPTDTDLQLARSLQLNVDVDSQTDRLLSIPGVNKEWNKAKSGNDYWNELSKEYLLDVNKPDEFAALFRLSKRPEDKQIAFNYNANLNVGITELEDALNVAVGQKAKVNVKKFGALTQDVLRQTIAEMKKAKAKEQELALFSDFGQFSEIIDINKQLSNSIFKDTGIGGVLSFVGGNKAQESFEKSLQGITGVNNNTVYNWQSWFDNTLKKRYEKDVELGLSTSEAKEKIKIEGEFARDFLDQYLIPRFNESRSMDEFVDYLDVKKNEQNPFQTQDIVNAVKLVADIKATQYLDQLKKTPDRYFDSEFYFNPTGDKARKEAYINQSRTVNQDWEAAKKGNEYWAKQAYRFGVNVNNKNEFAKMHFQVKGQGKGFDAADDILNATKVSEYIYGKILPALKEEALEQGTVFGQFIKPSEFADEMLKGVNPGDEEWNKILKNTGLEDFNGTIDELKGMIGETLRTGSAQRIRENIKYLNEKRKKPTQKLLGVTYIEREEDYKNQAAKADTELFKVFQSAGFQGTEDEFYEDFFPDIDRTEQAFLDKAGKKQALKMEQFNLSDPFASLGKLESLFGDQEKETTDDDDEESSSVSSYFRLDDDDDYKNKKTTSGQSFLGEFTSMFNL